MPTPGQFSFPSVTAICPPGATRPVISITFPNRPDLDGDVGILNFSDGTSYGVLVFQSGQTVTIPYPASNASPLTLTYRIMGETATADGDLPQLLGDHDDRSADIDYLHFPPNWIIDDYDYFDIEYDPADDDSAGDRPTASDDTVRAVQPAATDDDNYHTYTTHDGTTVRVWCGGDGLRR